MKRIVLMFLLELCCIAGFAQNNASWLNADTLKARLSAAPNYYQFTGGYGRYKAIKDNVSIDITYNTTTKEISVVSCKVAVNKLHPSIWDAKDIFKFYSAIDHRATTYYRTRYKKMIESKYAYDKTEPYVNVDKSMRFLLGHNLFDARKAADKPDKGTIYLSAEIDRLL